jgi:hypothetical protein
VSQNPNTLFFVLDDFEETTLDVAERVLLLLFEVGERAIAPSWRCLARSTNASRIGLSGMKRERSLQTNLVLSEGFKIVFIEKALFHP